MIDKKLVEEICKEICFYDADGPSCDTKCDKCNRIYWRHFKKNVEIMIKTYLKLKEGKNGSKTN